MNIKEIYYQDSKHVSRWKKQYTDKEFYTLNRDLRKKLDQLIDAKKCFTPRELWMAGMIYHHGFTLSSSKRALLFAERADDKGYKPAKTLIAQATDRLLQLQGKPQKFGTCAVMLKNGQFKLYRIDGTVTDAMRKEYGLPPLKILKAYLNA